MSDLVSRGFPRQMLSIKSKTNSWRKKCLDWADSKTFTNHSLIRNSIKHKKINYDLVTGKLHMDDLQKILNPEDVKASYIPDNIQHYNILLPKLNVLKGEESKRVFDYRVVITNPNGVAEVEKNKKEALMMDLQEWIQNESMSEEEAQAELSKLSDYYNYEWQDLREMRANALLTHYSKELNFNKTFTDGFMDGMTVGEEIYQCDIVGGEPTLTRINNMKLRAYKSGVSNRIEDADMIIIEDYWSPGKIIDTFYDSLEPKDIKYIETLLDNVTNAGNDNEYNPVDERNAFVNKLFVGDNNTINEYYSDLFNDGGEYGSVSPYDLAGNIRVLRLYWKSKRKIKKIKYYDQETGEELIKFMPESYIADESRGEEEKVIWINQAWEGTKIGKDIYVNMGPRKIQYNSISNPSRCHFGIIGSIYNTIDDKPFSLVDMMKTYNYAYDIYHDRLNKLLARTWGTGVNVDLAKVPDGWGMDKWMYYARVFGLYVENSFNVGNEGPATGKLAGAMNNATSRVVNANDAQLIQQYISILQFISQEMSNVVGITPQREGQVANRETVGGVERATLQSSYITEWLFVQHDDVKRRVLEAFLETAKIALKGKSKKFQYLLSDATSKIIDIDGDEFAECDYGLIVDNSNGAQELKQKLDMLAQAALQNQTLDFSTIMAMYNSISLAEKQRIVERNEQRLREQQQDQQMQEQQMQQQQLQQQMQIAQQAQEMQYKMHQEDNETKILVAQINSKAEADRLALMNRDNGTLTEKDKADLDEKIRQFDEKLKLDKDKLSFERDKAKKDAELKLKQINKPTSTKK